MPSASSSSESLLEQSPAQLFAPVPMDVSPPPTPAKHRLFPGNPSWYQHNSSSSDTSFWTGISESVPLPSPVTRFSFFNESPSRDALPIPDPAPVHGSGNVVPARRRGSEATATTQRQNPVPRRAEENVLEGLRIALEIPVGVSRLPRFQLMHSAIDRLMEERDTLRQQLRDAEERARCP
ncbi:hypothetical protein BC834DRAFT_893497 [Gloeopeniophorella convolvens]|nr:hypothetical protein BC834DRAFT_893497 [Gloeopeniophorella convolvens]